MTQILLWHQQHFWNNAAACLFIQAEEVVQIWGAEVSVVFYRKSQKKGQANYADVSKVDRPCELLALTCQCFVTH